MTILLAAGDCFEAFLLAPIAAALQRRGAAHRLLGAPASTIELPGVPAQALATLPTAAALVDLLGDATVVAFAGRSAFALAVAAAGRQRGLRVVHLDGGVRTSGGRGDGERRAADAAATEWLVDGETDRRELRRDGHAHHAIRVVGSLIAAALAAVAPPAGAGDGGTFVALEHAPMRGPLRTALAQLGCELPEPDQHGPHWRVAEFLRPALTAGRLVTDSIGWQRLACARGIPCMVAPGAASWPAGIAAGLVTQAGAGEHELRLALARAHLARPQPALAATGTADRIADALLHAPTLASAPLPSDGDASGRTFGDDEIALVTAVLRSGTLNSTRGTMVTAFERRFAAWLGRKHAIACASGSAAMHAAIAALQLAAGDEVVTTPITDMGALTPISYEGGVPVFADVDPATLNVTADTIARCLTKRTRAIVVTHLFGRPCDLDGIRALASERGLPLIEDAAQAFGATWRGARIGTFGAIAAFSLQQGKHITTGEGGIVATDDDALARRLFLFVNKAWGYGDPKPDHYFPAPNYRLTELQGAVALAQLPKLEQVVAARRAVAAALQRELAAVPGLQLPGDPPHGTHSWWKFAFHVDPAQVPGGAVALGKRMQQAGIACVPRYIQKPAFECELYRDFTKSPVTALPLAHSDRSTAPMPLFTRADFPGAVAALDQVIVLPINERYTDENVRTVATAIAAAVAELRRG
ncbi:MAG: DegT/DnrJ/EryC1/StrS family aminotransferase [Planctomycetota bacterium]